MYITSIIIVSVLILYVLILIPIQYSNISAMKEEMKQKENQSHNELYENKSFEEQELQYNLQGSIINLPSSLIATLIYQIKHRGEK
jgi:hypothetical protein